MSQARVRGAIAIRGKTSGEEGEREWVRTEWPGAVLKRVRAMQWLASASDRSTYRARQREIAQQLNVSIRQVQRLIRAWETSGIRGLERKERSDSGRRRLDEEWTKYIVQTYRAGNRSGRRMSRAQVAVRVAARALEIGDSHPPSRISVYRILQSEIDRAEDRSRVRSIGWQGERMILKTREGLEVEIKHSNQVWQCDHTRVDVLVVDQAGEVLGCRVSRYLSLISR